MHISSANRPVPTAAFSRLFVPVAAALLILVSSAARGDIDRSHPPAPGPEPVASFPDYQTATLPNGLKIFVIENHREPTVTFRLLIRSGEALDGDKPGLADMTAALLNRGTSHRSAAQFAEETDFLGASVEAGAGPDSTEVSANGLVKDAAKLIDLFADAALNPVFPAEEVALEQRQEISELEADKQRPGTLAERLRDKLIFGPTNPYGAYSTEASLSAISREDLAGFHARFFSPDNATLAIVGDVHAADIIPVIGKAFASWQSAGKVPDQSKLADVPAPPTSRVIYLVDRPGSVQSTILVAGKGMARDNPDTPEFNVVDSVLGGGMSGRLFQNLRERHGYTYGSGSTMEMNRWAGVFSASAEVRNEVTVPAIQEILGEITRLDNEPVPEPELAMQRQFLAGNYLLSLENPRRTAERVQAIDLYGLPADFYRTYARRVGDVSAPTVQALAKKYLVPEQMTIVVVGEAKDIKAPLEKLGTVKVYDTDLKEK
jgi:predicted Zn-dependent peptidase